MSHSKPPADPSVFEDTDRHNISLAEADLLGSHTYENVLYTGPEAHALVDVTTGDTPSDLDRTTEEAQQFAARVSNADRVSATSTTEVLTDLVLKEFFPAHAPTGLTTLTRLFA